MFDDMFTKERRKIKKKHKTNDQYFHVCTKEKKRLGAETRLQIYRTQLTTELPEESNFNVQIITDAQCVFDLFARYTFIIMLKPANMHLSTPIRSNIIK